MSTSLLAVIQRRDSGAATTLEGAGFRTDSELHSLTRQDLHELFPAVDKLKMRRDIFEIIHKQKPINVVLEELKGFIPHESFRSALTNNGVLVDYLHILKDIKTQVNNVQTFLDAHIDLLENMSKTQPDPEPGKGSLPGTSDSSCGVEPCSHENSGYPQEARGDSIRKSPQDFQQATVKYKMIVSGKTFGTHHQLMDQVKTHFQDGVQFVENSQDFQVIIVFCPISSRVGSDVEAALADVKDDKPIILVLMHHTREVKCTSSVKPGLHVNVVFQVSVFFHETIPGLLKCKQNDQAVSVIQKELLMHSGQFTKDAIAGMDAESDRSDSASTSVPGFLGFLSSFKK
ncbi:uncharacterized protein LOC130187684 [Seriola aureovittata]|uniref:uncharacterized protein LOC130187684 n=1 Tax=Seriola aureovittata TaxID=2871759 RepID=UPI0024BE12D3|nr:uncharacterized protein LOC130187684 [Seriola aureovittata]